MKGLRKDPKGENIFKKTSAEMSMNVRPGRSVTDSETIISNLRKRIMVLESAIEQRELVGS